MTEKMYQELWGEGGQHSLVKKGVVLRTYTGEEVRPKKSSEVIVSYEEKGCQLPLLPYLLGRNWLEEIKLNWQTIKHLTQH